MSAPTQPAPAATRTDPYAPKGLSLTLESTDPAGTTFRLTLPLVKSG